MASLQKRYSPPPLSCDETLEGAGEEVHSDVEYDPILNSHATSPRNVCLQPPFISQGPLVMPTEITTDVLLRTPRGSPTMTAFGSFSPTCTATQFTPEIAELFPPINCMSDMVYEVGRHSPWSLSPPHGLCHYPMQYYS